ncbi:hypothetical protein N5094_16675 [Shewanella putrefaciens]|jgi:hypothetical protein|uniref:hypothetical protein n=1 Tax=Shewanella TaxID=22 RepID=UPI002004C045|nr:MULTISPECIES: hypothetical protein [Shewanella]MCK7632307.1 hypothetical protein [Shewanella sp. JNE9-1]MCK7647457.1 hypothetical protein [Shewanella sp. JNE3-1]MCK7655607.1 hypothetical protein [Shewanella sp. JNE4-1]UPO25856.1 hypothetical protein MZ018_13025 [Shewanella sp. JNE10-2]UPO26309.1 hypothetical protein MZ018_15595 [Shewanella sp. JNE10-2]
MIELDTWLENIIGTCEMLTDGTIEQAWLSDDGSKTSITSFDELYEQIFDDLDSEQYVQSSEFINGLTETSRHVVNDFFVSIQKLDDYKVKGNIEQSSLLLESKQWSSLLKLAERLLRLLKAEAKKV